jgi:hypothetical protein
MSSSADAHDVMQVCRNGHVVTESMRGSPEQSRYHCDRCGALTLHACPTCGAELPGAMEVRDLAPVGSGKPPLFCSSCGAAFPWTTSGREGRAEPAAQVLETFFRRLPLVIRGLRERWGTRPPFRIEDEHDLEDLVRSFLPLYFDGVRLRSRTPSYAQSTRTDFLIESIDTVCTVKCTSLLQRQDELAAQRQEDVKFYRSNPEACWLWIWIFDAQQYLQEPYDLEMLWSERDEQLEVRCVISA